MLKEWLEFLDYTGTVTYTGNKSKDASYMGRFTFKNILEFEGLPRILTIIARGYMYHDKDGALLKGDPRERLGYVRKSLCAWCSVPDSKNPLSAAAFCLAEFRVRRRETIINLFWPRRVRGQNHRSERKRASTASALQRSASPQSDAVTLRNLFYAQWGLSHKTNSWPMPCLRASWYTS